MSLVTPLVSSLIAELTAAPGGSSLPYAPPPPPPPPPPPQPAVLAITQIGPQEAGGNVPVSYSIDKTDRGVAAVLYAATDPAPLAADFNGAGAPTYADLGTVALDTSGTPLDLVIPDGLNGSYRLALLPTSGGDVAVSAPVTIDTTVAAPPPPDPMADDAGKLYWYGYDDTTRSGTYVTAVNDKSSNGRHLNSIGAFGAPQQTDAASPMVFNPATPTVIQTATASTANRVMIDHLSVANGSLRFFAVLDGATLGTSYGNILTESESNSENQSIGFSVKRNSATGHIEYGVNSRKFANAMSPTTASSTVLAASAGLFIYEIVITQTTWTALLNGALVGSGSVTASNLAKEDASTLRVRTSLGARASATVASIPVGGNLYEVFVTRTTDDTHAGTVRGQLAAAYSITL